MLMAIVEAGATESNTPNGTYPPHLNREARKNIPQEIQKIQQWVTFKYGPINPATGKRAKLPQGADGTGREWQKEHQWLTFDDAIDQATRRGHAGIGLVLPATVFKGEYLVATDHDNVGLANPDPATNPRLAEIKAQAKALGNPYTERTPSGNGLRMLATSTEPLTQISSSPNPHGGADEMFCVNWRWITVTGDKWDIWDGDGVPEATDALKVIHAQWTERQSKDKASAGTAAVGTVPALRGFDEVRGLPDPVNAAILSGEPESPEAVERVRGQLACISADCSYERWRNTVWGVLSTGWDCSEALAREWSEGAVGKFDEGAFQTLVNSYKPGGRITLGTVVHYAKEGGWTDAGARREAQRRENAALGAGEVFIPQPEVLTVPEMLERFIYLADGSRVFDIQYPKHVLSLADFRNAVAASTSTVSTGLFTALGVPKSKRVPNCQTWMESPLRLSAHATTFDASAGRYTRDPLGRDCVNVWTGFDRSVDPEGADISFVLEHIRWLFKDRADDFLDWIAHIEQYPGVLPHAMWLHISSHTGTGRNAISRLLSRVFPGHAAMSLALERVLDSGFNEELSAKVLAVVDEIRMGGKDQWRHSEALKQLVTAQVRHINAKYGRMSVEANACRFLVFSNHRNALPIDDTDRRIEVVICDDKARDAAHYMRLYRAVDDVRVVAGFARFLKGRDLSSYNPGAHARKTASKAQVMAVSASDEYAALREFTATYTPPLATAARLERAAGVSGFGSDGNRFKHAVMDAGWQKVGRVAIKGVRTVVYAKRESAEHWTGRPWDSKNGLPVCDGGVLAWDEVAC